ncbi:MAG: hypothetical protein ACKO2L_12585 [Planctomycetaceae bacterium]
MTEFPGGRSFGVLLSWELLFLLAALVAWCFGGWPALLLLLVMRCLREIAAPIGRELALLSIPGFWLMLQWYSADRRLFFSWTMGLAACVLTSGVNRRWAIRLVSGAGVVAVFLAIRVQQRALPRVLLIETLSAVGILAASALLHGGRPGHLFADAVVVAAASILACFSLAI